MPAAKENPFPDHWPLDKLHKHRSEVETGRLQVTQYPRTARVIRSDTKEIEISGKALNRAFDGDMVVLIKGKVVQIERAKRGPVPMFLSGNKLLPLDGSFPSFMAPKDFPTKNYDNHYVFVDISTAVWPASSNLPRCTTIVNVIGPTRLDLQLIAVERRHDFGKDPLWSKEIMDFVSQLEPPRPEEDRTDLRDWLTFTIDPPGARDLDDAVSLRECDNGDFEIGVHIADVSAYVPKDSALDKEAGRRSTSVYLDRTIRMLPEELSDNLCSLLPKQDRYALTLILKVSSEGRMEGNEFRRTLIRSSCQLDYDTAQSMIEGKFQQENSSYESEDPAMMTEIAETTRVLSGLCQAIYKRRLSEGHLSLQNKDLEYTYDEDHRIIKIETNTPRDSHTLIAELAIQYNMQAVNQIFDDFGKNFVVRAQPPPDQKILDQLRQNCATASVMLDVAHSNSLQKSIEDASVSDLQKEGLLNMINRATSAASYAVATIRERHINYEMHSEIVGHATSPIRRFVDLVTHRQLIAGITKQSNPYSEAELDAMLKHTKQQKKDSSRVENAHKKVRVIDFLSRNPTKCQVKGVITDVDAERIQVFVPLLRYTLPITFKEHEVKRSKPHQLVVDHEHKEYTFSVLSEVQLLLLPKTDKPVPYLHAAIDWHHL